MIEHCSTANAIELITPLNLVDEILILISICSILALRLLFSKTTEILLCKLI